MKCLVCATEPAKPYSEGAAQDYLKCPHCGLVWVNPQHFPSLEREKRRYLQHKNSLEEPAYLDYLARAAAPVADLQPPGARGLDYGCGPVEGMKHVLEPRLRVDSYDPIFFPREELLKFRYDFVLCIEAAEHFHDPLTEFARIDSTLVQGGILVVSSLLLPAPSEFSRWHYRRDFTHVVFYAEETVHWLAAHFGWEVLSLRSPLWVMRKA
jgi:hypothetical protein